MPNKYCTIEECATANDMTPAYVRQLCAEGRIRADKVGRTWLVLRRTMTEIRPSHKKAGRPRKAVTE